MTQPDRDFSALAGYSLSCIQSGNLPMADLTARLLLKEDEDYPPAHILLGMVAMNVRMFEVAVRHFKVAIRLDPDNRDARQWLTAAKAEQAKTSVSPGAGPGRTPDRYLLIKSWGYGLWSDLDHVLGQCLLAEMTGRIPVVHWGANSLFRNPGVDNAFTQFFEAVSGNTIMDLTDRGLSFYPPKWSDTNLAMENINKWDGPYSRMTGLYFLNRDEDVVVSDFHTYLADLLPWLPARHEYHGLGPQEVYRRIYRKYIRPRQEILSAIEDYWTENLRGRHTLAVHVRSSDKIIEIPDLQRINASIHARIEEYLNRRPETFIYILTDSEDVLNEYRNRYADRLLYMNCTRTATDQGIHLQPQNDKQRIGTEVIIDACLAAKCDYFIGVGHSNVSTSILHMREWTPSSYHIIGENLLLKTNFSMHKR